VRRKKLEVKELEEYLHEQIPASKLLEIGVISCSHSKVELMAPLAPNINHKNTVFGGSLSVLAILAGWSLVYLRIKGVQNEIVIQESAMTYLKAANGEFYATSSYEDQNKWERFSRSFTKRGKGRIQVNSNIICNSKEVATFQGTYVAFNKEFF
jgi:thioesterase domain-containing protein